MLCCACRAWLNSLKMSAGGQEGVCTRCSTTMLGRERVRAWCLWEAACAWSVWLLLGDTRSGARAADDAFDPSCVTALGEAPAVTLPRYPPAMACCSI